VPEAGLFRGLFCARTRGGEPRALKGLARSNHTKKDRTIPDTCQTSPLTVRRIGGVTMAENHFSRRPPITRKPHKYQADEDLGARFLCHANSTHVLQSLWRGLTRVGCEREWEIFPSPKWVEIRILGSSWEGPSAQGIRARVCCSPGPYAPPPLRLPATPRLQPLSDRLPSRRCRTLLWRRPPRTSRCPARLWPHPWRRRR
jgi:hypothetical protein